MSFLVCVAAGCADDDGGGSDSTSTTVTLGATTSSTTSVTSVSSSTITTSSTLGGLTTTTDELGSSVCDCVVTFAVTNSETLGALQYDTLYPSGSEGFDGVGATVSCARLAGDFAAFNDVESARTLSTAIVSSAGFTGPVDIARCDWTGNLPSPVPGDFAVTVTDQSRPDFSPASATVAVRDVTCACSGPATTTTTTLPEVGDPYLVAFDLEDSVTLGALQFEVDYGGAGGTFAGVGYDVACESPLTADGAFVSINEVGSLALLIGAFVSLDGFTGPTTVATCTFLRPDTPPVPEDFVITTVDASEPNLAPVFPLPTVGVSAITPQ
jgi:hypothetical protein